MPLDGTTYNNDPILYEIRRAKQTLLEKGWCQGTFINSQGAVCIAGSFGYAYGIQPTKTQEDAFEFIVTLCAIKFNAFAPFWNDAYNRTPEEVLALLDAAIEKRLQEITVTV